MESQIGAIIQARLGSTRLPRKVFCEITGKPLIEHIVNRVSKSVLVDQIILATTDCSIDDDLETWAIQNKIECFRGDELDVLSRFYKCALKYKLDVIVRVTADDPFKDSELIDEVIKYYKKNSFDFVSNNNPPSYPEGFDVEVFSMNALELAFRNAVDIFDREHVTQFFYKNPIKIKVGNLSYEDNISHLRCTIDTEKDLEMARLVYTHLYSDAKTFKLNDILELFQTHPEIPKININEQRSTMYIKSK